MIFMSENNGNIRLMEIPYWTARICEVAAFWNLVVKGNYHRTHPGMDDGVGSHVCLQRYS